MIRNTSGKKDAILTMSIITMTLILIKVMLAGFTVTIGTDVVVNFGTIDAAIIGALLTPTLSAYVARRYTEHKFRAITGDNPAVEAQEGSTNAGQP